MSALPLIQSGPADGGNFEYHWTGGVAQAHLLSDVGKKRKTNQDSCVMCAPEDPVLLEVRGLLFAVADGMGGANAGEYASRLALEVIVDGYYRQTSGGLVASMREALEEANRRVYQESLASLDRQGMGTTVSLMTLRGDCAYVGQVGDSRVYVARNKTGILQITDDHSLVAEQVRNGYISADEARNHSMKNLITRAVGIKDNVKADLFAFQVTQDDTFCICSDGLSNLVKDQEIYDALAMDNLQAAARVLVGRALDAGGADNITVLLLRIMETPPNRPIEAGAVEVAFPKVGLLGKIKGFLHKP